MTEKLSVLAGLRFDHADVSRTDLTGGTGGFDQGFSNRLAPGNGLCHYP
jgi:iron complex outermembrane receptor protein